jgi:hypothetical protein
MSSRLVTIPTGHGTTVPVPYQCASQAEQYWQASAEREQQVKACYDRVNSYQQRQKDAEREQQQQEQAAKDAERQRQERAKQIQDEMDRMKQSSADRSAAWAANMRRLQEEQQRIAAEAEQARRDAANATIKQAFQDIRDANARTNDYLAKTAAANAQHVPLTNADAQMIASLREQAENNALRPRYVHAEPSGHTVTDLSGVKAAAWDIVKAEWLTIAKWGLSGTETGRFVYQVLATGDDYYSKYDDLMSSVSLARSGLAGTATTDEEWQAMTSVAVKGSRLSMLELGNPLGAVFIGKAIGATGAGWATGFKQLDIAIPMLDKKLTPEEIASLQGYAAERAIIGRVLPVDRADRFYRVGTEIAGAYDGYNRGFLTIYGR